MLIYSCVFFGSKTKYIFSFNGAIDVVAVLPSWISIFFGLGANSSFLRILRMLRIGKLFNNLPDPVSCLFLEEIDNADYCDRWDKTDHRDIRAAKLLP